MTQPTILFFAAALFVVSSAGVEGMSIFEEDSKPEVNDPVDPLSQRVRCLLNPVLCARQRRDLMNDLKRTVFSDIKRLKPRPSTEPEVGGALGRRKRDVKCMSGMLTHCEQQMDVMAADLDKKKKHNLKDTGPLPDDKDKYKGIG